MPIVEGAKVVGIVTRGDIVRVLARDDTAIAADIRHRLEIYGGLNRWTVEVQDGVVRIVDAFDNSTDRHVASMLAQAVPGVVDARTRFTGNGRSVR
jgi:CBS domain-containing protein